MTQMLWLWALEILTEIIILSSAYFRKSHPPARQLRVTTMHASQSTSQAELWLLAYRPLREAAPPPTLFTQPGISPPTLCPSQSDVTQRVPQWTHPSGPVSPTGQVLHRARLYTFTSTVLIRTTSSAWSPATRVPSVTCGPQPLLQVFLEACKALVLRDRGSSSTPNGQ